MQDAAAVRRMVHGFRKGGDELGRRAKGHRLALLEPGCQRDARAVGGGKEGDRPLLAGLVNGDEVGVVQNGRRLGFLLKPGPHRSVVRNTSARGTLRATSRRRCGS